MPLEKGGRADKVGNKYEINCIIYELLNIINENNYSVVIEALGEDEQGTDILITHFNGIKEHQQCKVRNASKEYWTISDLKERNIFKNWYTQLCRDVNREVALVSPIGCSFLTDLHDRAVNTTGIPEVFFKNQIQGSDKEFVKFYEKFCKEMDLNHQDSNDVLKSIDFLRRITFKQISEYTLKELIYQKIEFYFCSNKNEVYNALVTYVVTGDILGKEITIAVLQNYLKSQNIAFRLLDRDKRIISQIIAINEEYRNSFKTLQEGLIKRSEFEKCIEAIKEEQNLIISGNAGYGKSGCTEAILDYCENENIPYIAIKLDRKIPQKNCEIWGKELGFSSSISYILHSISKNKKAVIILDQLDALRWTQANSREALTVCMELIKQVKYLNNERQHKIIIVFVCRTYDLHNDNNIKILFKSESNLKQENEKWKKIIVQNFEEDIVKKIIGEKYKKLSTKTKQLLQIPSNLYIWQHLDKNEIYDDCLTTSHLIERWYQQICKKSITVGIQESVVKKTQKEIVFVLDKSGRLYIPKQVLQIEETGLEYLISEEMVILEKHKVGFVHQSILDYFISERMMKQYFDGENIEEIIGEKNRQTPSRRYQIQMFLQNLLEYDSTVFIEVGKKLQKSNKVRYYVKSVFYEILATINKNDNYINKFILEGCKNNEKMDYLLNNVINGNYGYITLLRENGVLDKWFLDEKTRNKVHFLLKGISPNFSSLDIEFIKKYAFKNKENDKQFMGYFLHNMMEESDEVFQLRMLFYQHYPEWIQEFYIDVQSAIKNYTKRTIRIISFLLQHKVSSKGENLYYDEDELVYENDSLFIEDVCYVVDELLKYIPKEDSWKIKYGKWSGIYNHNRGLERVAIEMIKNANKGIINQNPELFWKYYEPYMGKNYVLYNELILHGLQFLSIEYSNRVILYLSKDLDKKIFDYTSGANKQLNLVTEVIKVHGALCDEEHLRIFENEIIKYISPEAVQWYKNRIEINKTKEREPVYWSFWGDLQYQLLQSIPYKRLSSESKKLLNVLERKFKGKSWRYFNGGGHWGGVSSPVSGKKIGKNQWLQIITNRKLTNRKHCNWKEVNGGFIESSLETYASDFSLEVRKNPEEMIQLVLSNKKYIVPFYIDSLYSGAAFSEKFEEVSQQTWENLFKEFSCDFNSNRISYFCTIIEKSKDYKWSLDVLAKLNDIAVNSIGEIAKNDLEEIKNMDSENLYLKSMNCVSGNVAMAIGNLLLDNEELFLVFKNTIDMFTIDKNPVVNMASLGALWSVYDIDREWAEERILRLYESDIRMAAFHNSKNMFYRLYTKYKERILQIIKSCFESKDKKLIQLGGYCICEFFIQYGEFVEKIEKFEELNEEKIKTILYMAVNYLKYEKYRDKSKEVILKYKNSKSDVEYPLAGLFYHNLVDIERDSDFLIQIMNSKVSNRMVCSFVHFLEKNACSIKEYAKIIITLCENVLNMNFEEIKKQWGIEDDISKLIISLYDECANSEDEDDKQIAEKCLELWDLMFEKEVGSVRELSRKLTER